MHDNSPALKTRRFDWSSKLLAALRAVPSQSTSVGYCQLDIGESLVRRFLLTLVWFAVISEWNKLHLNEPAGHDLACPFSLFSTRLARALDTRIAPHVRAALGLAPAFATDERLSFVGIAMVGMGRAPDKAHRTAAIGTRRAVTRTKLWLVLTLQHEPRVKSGRSCTGGARHPGKDPSLP